MESTDWNALEIKRLSRMSAAMQLASSARTRPKMEFLSKTKSIANCTSSGKPSLARLSGNVLWKSQMPWPITSFMPTSWVIDCHVIHFEVCCHHCLKESALFVALRGIYAVREEFSWATLRIECQVMILTTVGDSASQNMPIAGSQTRRNHLHQMTRIDGHFTMIWKFRR